MKDKKKYNISKYKIIQEIYNSKNTEVYRAVRKDNTDPVILKIRNESVTQNLKNALKIEFEFMKSIKSNYIINYIKFEHYKDISIMVFEDCKMYSLKKFIPKDGFKITEFLILAIELFSAIEEVHNLQIIHKDINPSNILVNVNLNKIKLIDFEFATSINEEIIDFESPNIMNGTLGYISPEQTGRINKPVDLRADLYSAGVTLYQMITGKLPFSVTNPGELIYSHLAKVPEPVSKIRQDIPLALNNIIEKLIKKSPNERYQSAKGVKDDLIYLQKAHEKREEITNFIPGKNEIANKFYLTNALYGRNDEKQQLLDCFDSIKQKGQLVTVTGPVGIGKTSLIRELYKPITQKKGFYLSGKFDQQNNGRAYSALADAFQNFIKQCSGNGDEAFVFWKNKIQASVKEFGQVLIDIIPEFFNLIGKQQVIAPISSEETIVRRNKIFSDLIQDICNVGQPVVLSLDNLQWGDSATLSLLNIIIEKKIKNLQIILSYRENEIDTNHPLTFFLAKLRDNNISQTNIKLKELSRKSVSSWIFDILPENSDNVDSLVSQIIAKTEGNPFYIRTFLSLLFEKKYIKQDNDGQISINIKAIDKIPADKNVVEHLIKKINNLKKSTKEFLAQLSILGSKFTINQIVILFDKTYFLVYEHIKILISSHILIKSRENILFAHEKIQEAAYNLLDKNTIAQLHLKIGKKIQESLRKLGLEKERIEDYIHHLNFSAKLIQSQDERIELAKLNMTIGKRLKNNAAYRLAEKYFKRAIELLPEDSFNNLYRLSVEIFLAYGEILFLNSNYDEGEKQFEIVIKNSKSPLDTANVYIIQIVHHASHHNLKKSMKIALYALETLKVKLPKKGLKLAVLVNLIKVKLAMRKVKPGQILDFPITEDALTLAQMNVLGATIVAAYIGFPDYYPIISLKMAEISVRKGNSPMSSFAWVNYGLILSTLGEFTNGYEFGKASLKLMKKLNVKLFETKISYMHGMMINHWKKPAYDGVKYLETSLAKGLETGDYEFASYAANNIMHVTFFAGKKIPDLLRQYPKQHEILRQFNKKHTMFEAKFWNQMLIVLNDKNSDGITVKGKLIDENELMPILENNRDYSSLAICKITKMMLAYLANDYETALNNREKSFELHGSVTGTVFIPVSHFFGALTCVQYYKKINKSGKYLSCAKKSLRKLRKWGNAAPDNYLYKAQLVEAEILSINGKMANVLKLYEKSIYNANKGGNKLDLGIAYECMGRYLMEIGFKSMGLMQIQNSYDVFKQWGAINKSNRLKDEFNIKEKNEFSQLSQSINTHSNLTINTILDMETLIASIKSLTSDLQFDTLMENLLGKIMQSSGATRVVYIHNDQSSLVVRAEKYQNAKVKIINSTGIESKELNLPISIIDRCYNDKKKYIIQNIEKDDLTGKKSVLIFPLLRHKSTIGLIFLENDLFTDAFRSEQIQFLKLLAGQAAIAVENSIIFENLNYERNFNSSIIQNSPNLICGINNDGITTFINPAVEQSTGYSKEELIGKNWWEILYPGEEYSQVTEMFKHFTKGEVYNYEMRHINKNGEKRNVSWNSFTKKDGHKNIQEIIGFGIDITARKKAERLSKEHEEQYRLLFERSNDAIFMIEAGTGKYLDANKAAEKLTGRKISELKKTTIFDITPINAQNRLQSISETNENIDFGEVTYLHLNGSKRVALLNAIPITNNIIIGMARDITEQKKSQEIMIQNEKMMSVGGLAAGMAHEINNPLAGIIQNVQVMENRLTKKIPANNEVADKLGIKLELIIDYINERGIATMLQDIKNAGIRASIIVKNMLGFAREGKGSFTSNDLEDLINKTLKLVSTDYDLKKHYDFKLIKIKKKIEQNIPNIFCDAGKIQQVFINIFRNGAEAMMEAKTRNPEFYIRMIFEEKNKMVKLEIIDNGPGLDKDLRKRIFEPFFTTKDVGKGTGLGLSVSYFIITEDHGGEMYVESEDGKGTNFVIRLPINNKLGEI